MRTDVKVGLVCVFAVVLAVVCYFTLHDKNNNVTTAGGSGAVATETPSLGNTGRLPVSTPPTTAPSASVADSTPTFASSGGSLLGPTAAYGQVSPPVNTNGMNGTVISPPGAATNPSMTPTISPMDGSAGMTPPGSMNTPLIPSPTLTTPGAMGGTGNPGLSTSPLPPSNGTEPPTTSILPPPAPFSTPGNGTLTLPGTGTTSGSAGSRGSTHGVNPKPKRGTATVDLTNPQPTNNVDILGGSMGGTGASYAIQKGDTLGALAKRNGVSVKAILAANPGVNPNRLKVGQKVNIPAPGATPATRPASSSRGATTRGSGTKGKSTKSATTHPAVGGGSYTVKKGDTLRKIAKATYGDENMWRRIFRANRGDMASANDLTVGEVIKLPATQ